MKLISFILITLWSIWTIVTNKDLKPSENYFLWILSALSVIYSTINIIFFYVDFSNKNKLNK